VDDVEGGLTTAYDVNGHVLKLSVETDQQAQAIFPRLIQRMFTSARIVASPTGREDEKALKTLLLNELMRRGFVVIEEQSLDCLAGLLPEEKN
jgi:hypothetical protein